MIDNLRSKIQEKQKTEIKGQNNLILQLQNPIRIKQLLKKFLQSVHFQDWLKLNQVISIKYSDPTFGFLFADSIRYSIDYIKSFSTFMFLYSLYRKKIFRSFPYIRWEKLYNDVCIFEKQIIVFNSWIESIQRTDQATCQKISKTLIMVAQNFGDLLKNQRIKLTDIQFQSIIQWVILMKTQKESEFQITCNLVKVIKQARMIESSQFVTKGHLILKRILQNLGKFEKTSGNTFLLLDPLLFKEKDIHYFCNIYYEFLTNLNQQHILNVFKGLTVCGITKEALLIISQIIHLLQNNEEYFKLRVIYQEFVLPYLCEKMKTHKILGQQIFVICQYCIIGFTKHCFIGVQGLICILKNIQLIQQQSLVIKWLKLGLIIEKLNGLQNQSQIILLKNKLGLKLDIKRQELDVVKENIWQVTLRTGRKHKKYNKTSSNLRGIQNNSNQCYIISAVQALFMTKQLQKLLQQNKQIIKGKLQVMDQLRILFAELQGKIKAKVIVVNYLKKYGPEQFVESPHQEDVQQYMLALFQVIQKQLKKYPILLYKFKEIFQINCKSLTQCLTCGKQFENQENQYVHTIPHAKLLQFKVEDELDDYQCINCHNKKCKNVRIINPNSKIFIVHINRFSHKNGVLKKQMSNQVIRRKIKSHNYQLQGMICHIGKNMQNGHYIYFAKISEKKWVEMNDRLTWQFDLQKDDEEFQREMQTELTPYILFYKRLQS